ncbi:MAG: putative DNA-binding protein [Acidimicrobiales bacterium]|nr:putative DNA-binding protein [Acidimicrobiales bacterium]
MTYARRVGERLRAIRKQKGLSLQEVEATSTQEFKASVLGAYERGERSISVPRLQRLARFYAVPVDQLLPQDVEIDLTDDDGGANVEPRRTAAHDVVVGKLTIDLSRIDELPPAEAEMLRRYVGMIQVQRQDFNGRMLTVRRDDARTLACFLNSDLETAASQLDSLALRSPG